jgi:hypothetical protein
MEARMQRRVFSLFRVLSVIALFALLAACGGGQATQDGGQTNGGPTATSPVDPATAATVSGQVLFTGAAPEPEPILMDAEPECQAQYPNGATTEDVLVNNGKLENVFVYVKSGLGDMKFSAPSEPVVLDQKGCRYQPHVLGVQVGQEFIIRNSDGILHNIHPVPKVNQGFNVGQPVNMDTKKTFDKVEVMIPIECDVHDWMSGYLGVLDHPYFAVSGADGSFSLANLPPGTYTLEAWHERYGTQTMEVTVGASETKTVEFSFSGS